MAGQLGSGPAAHPRRNEDSIMKLFGLPVETVLTIAAVNALLEMQAR